MIINKNNIYTIPPASKYFDHNKIDLFMEEDFTLQVLCKVNFDLLTLNQETFIISRNGRHAGISTYGQDDGSLFIHFTYWFEDETNESILKAVKYNLPKEYINLYNTYTMICDDKKKMIKCYVNNEQVGFIDYEGLKKISYSGAYYWFGCGTMLASDPEYMNIGDYDINFSFLSNTKMSIDVVDDITLNYKTKYTKDYVDNLKILSDQIPNPGSYGYFIDFNTYSKYKIWNMAFNGIYPIIYMNDNTHY